MIHYLQTLSAWDWFGLSLLLLIFEVAGIGFGYLLWLSASALLATLLTLAGAGWVIQFIVFALGAIAGAFLWQRQQAKCDEQTKNQPKLNSRGHNLIGQQFDLIEPISNGRGKIKVGDSVWPVSGPETPAGARVKVVGGDSVILQVECS